MTRTDNIPSAQSPSSATTIGWFFAVIVLIQIAGLFIQPYLGWGFDFWRLFPLPVSVVVLGFALLIMTPISQSRGVSGITHILDPVTHLIGRWNRALVVSAVSLLLLALFYLLRSRAHVYGDGYLAIEVATTPIKYWPLSEYFMKPLSLILFRFWTVLLSPAPDTSPAYIISALDALAGVISFWALYRLSRLLVTGVGRQWFLLLGSLASGSVVLFFGYIEYYTWPVCLVLWSLAFSVGYLKHRNRLWPAFITAIIGVGFHFFALPVLALSVVAWWISPNKHGAVARGFSFRAANLALVVLSCVAAVAYQLGGLQGPVLAVWPDINHHYWAFSPSHLLDILNEILLVAPLGLVGLILTAFGNRKEEAVDLAGNAILSVSLFLFLLTFWINPMLGAARDWDLLSFFGLPFSMWGVYTLLKHLPERVKMPGLLVQVLVLSLILLVPNLYEKNNLSVAAERLDSVLWQDSHYQEDYRQANNSRQWAGTLMRHVGNTRKAIRYLKRSAEAVATSSDKYAALASAYNRIGVDDSAYFYYRKAFELDPGNERLLMILSDYEHKANRPDRLLALARKAVEANPGSSANHYLLSYVYGRIGMADSALVHARLADKLKPNSKRIVTQLGIIHGILGQPDSAYYYLSRALEIAGPQNFSKSDYLALMASAIKSGRFDKARLVLQAIERLQPGAVDENNSLRKTLDEAVDRARNGK